MGGYDVVGDVHGCASELRRLLERLGYSVDERGRVDPPAGRTLVLVGDLIDRGPEVPAVVRLVMDMALAGSALCVRGNHEHQYLEHLAGEAPVAWGLAETLEQLGREPEELSTRFTGFARSLPLQLELDEGRLVVVHAGLHDDPAGPDSEGSRLSALYGGGARPLEWPSRYRGAARVVYGHTPIEAPRWLNRTLCLDTGCVYGGRLTALRYPELELVAVDAARTYYSRD